jgi:hypothetical protein
MKERERQNSSHITPQPAYSCDNVDLITCIIHASVDEDWNSSIYYIILRPRE